VDFLAPVQVEANSDSKPEYEITF
jgi:hypothetical protein